MSLKKEREKDIAILISRPDRIGDVILSTPVNEALHRANPRARIVWLVQPMMKPLLEGLPGVNGVLTFEPAGRHAGFRGFFTLVRELRSFKFRISVALQTQQKIAWAMVFAGIRYRVGPLSRIHSFFCYNRGMRQHRSQVEMHEADYNLKLLRRLGIRVAGRKIATQVSLTEASAMRAREWLASIGRKIDQEWVAIHPGMGGSALNWPEGNYVQLARRLAKDGVKVVFTFGFNEQKLMRGIEDQFATFSAEQRPVFYGGERSQDLSYLGGLFREMDVVVAPSTGPLHLAVAVGTRVVTFYSPVRVQSAIRWGPYVPLETDEGGAAEEPASVLVPDVYCGEDFKCRGTLCNYFLCMNTITIDQAYQEVRTQLRQAHAKKRNEAHGNS